MTRELGAYGVVDFNIDYCVEFSSFSVD